LTKMEVENNNFENFLKNDENIENQEYDEEQENDEIVEQNDDDINIDSDDDEEMKWNLENIDWNAVSKEMGDHVEIVRDERHPNVPLLYKKLRPVVSTQVLKDKLEEISKQTKNFPFIEILSKSTKQRMSIKNVDDDLKREMIFYDNALSVAKETINDLAKTDPAVIQRPNDYYAEMLKSDHHMSRVKGRILMEKKKISHVEDRKRNQRLKKYHKQVMVEKQKNENKKQAQSVEDEINKWKGNNAGKKDATLQEILKNARKEYIEKKKNQKKNKT